MYLDDWHSEVTNKEVGPEFKDGLTFILHATLRCPTCGNLSEIQSDGQPLDDLIVQQDSIECEIIDLALDRRCKSCGVSSEMPGKDLIKLRSQTAVITPKWLSSKKLELMATAETAK